MSKKKKKIDGQEKKADGSDRPEINTATKQKQKYKKQTLTCNFLL